MNYFEYMANYIKSGGSGGGEVTSLSQWEMVGDYRQELSGTTKLGDFSFVQTGYDNRQSYNSGNGRVCYRLKKNIPLELINCPPVSNTFELDFSNLPSEYFTLDEVCFIQKNAANSTTSKTLGIGAGDGVSIARYILPEVFEYRTSALYSAPNGIYLSKHARGSTSSSWVSKNTASVALLKCPKGADVPYYLNRFTNVPVEDFVEIFENLADISGEAEAKTITLGTTILNKLTEEQKNIAHSKGWNLA